MNRRLKFARIEAGMTQKQIAEKVDVSENSICKWETGRSIPDRETQERVAEILGVKRWEVFTS